MKKRHIYHFILIAAVFLVPVRNTLAAVAHVQTCKTVDNTDSGAPVTCSLTFTGSGDHSGVLSAVGYFGGATVPDYTTCKLDNTTSFTEKKTLEANTSGSVHLRASIWVLHNIAAGAHTVTCAYSNDITLQTFWFSEVSGLAGTDDGTGASASGTTNTPSTGTFTTTNSDDLNWTAMTADSSSFTAGSGWTIPTNGSETSGSNITGAVEYRANPGSTTGAGNLGATTTGAEWVAVNWNLKATGGGGGGSAAGANYKRKKQ